MKIQISISVRNPDWYWKEDDYQKQWIMINGDKVSKYMPAVTFMIDAEVQQHVKPQFDRYTFKVVAPDQKHAIEPAFREVLVQGLDVTEFVYADGKTPVIISKSILHNVMAAQNQGRGKFYWYYFINEDADYVQYERNIWLSREHSDYLQSHIPNFVNS